MTNARVRPCLPVLQLDRAKYQKFIKDRHAYIDLVSLQKVTPTSNILHA